MAASIYDGKEIARRLRWVPLATSFRSAYTYDNVLYLIAGGMIEAMSGQSWEDFVTARILEPALLGESPSTVRRPPDNVEAYELYLRGRHYWHQRSPGTTRLAIQHFERAIALEPGFALAFAGPEGRRELATTPRQVRKCSPRVVGWLHSPAEDGVPSSRMGSPNPAARGLRSRPRRGQRFAFFWKSLRGWTPAAAGGAIHRPLSRSGWVSCRPRHACFMGGIPVDRSCLKPSPAVAAAVAHLGLSIHCEA